MERISSSVTSSRAAVGSPPRILTTRSVETPRNQMMGRNRVAMPFTIGPSATENPSARCIAKRLATSSPNTIEK